MCGAILWVSKQNDSTTLQSIYSMHRWPPLQRRRNEICWRFVTSMLSSCSKMFILGKNWKTRYSMHGQWTNLHDQSQNGPKPVTNAWIDWYLTFITHVNTNSIVMCVVLQNNADWDCLKTPILWEILRTQNLLRVEHCAFLEVIRVFQSVGVFETNCSFAQFNRIWNHLFGRWIEIRRAACSRVMRFDCFCLWKHDTDYRENGTTCCHRQKLKISREDQHAE